MKTIVIGIGNLILGDDGIGIHIVRAVQQKYKDVDDVLFDEAQTGGMNLLDMIRGYDRAILVDAICNDKSINGEVKRFHLNDLPTVHSYNPHDVSFPDALLLAEQIGDEEIPKDICIIGVNLSQMPMVFSDTLSPQIQKCIPTAMSIIHEELEKPLRRYDKKDTCRNN